MTSAERREGRYQRRKALRDQKRQAFLIQYDNFALVIDMNNLYAAFKASMRGVSWKESVQKYEASVLMNLAETVRLLIEGRSVCCGFVEFYTFERGKKRLIKSVHILERIVQKCFCEKVLVPIISRFLIYDNGASLKNKGLHFSIRRLITHISQYYRHYKTNEGYCLQIDFSKYFDSIRHDVLLKAVNKYVKNPQVLKLLHDFITPFGDGISLGLGSQVSQISAIYYATPLDRFIKEKCHIKYYGRYMDDLYLLHPDKEYLQYCLTEISKVCTALKLTVNMKKTKIVRLSQGLVFLKGKYTLLPSGRILKRPDKESAKRMRRKLGKFKKLLVNKKIGYDDIRASYQSWRGNYKRRFHVYHGVRHMDEYYNDLFINEH